MHVRMYACMYVDICLHGWMYGCMDVRRHYVFVCMYVGM